jgi:hypothetical protein
LAFLNCCSKNTFQHPLHFHLRISQKSDGKIIFLRVGKFGGGVLAVDKWRFSQRVEQVILEMEFVGLIINLLNRNS